MPSWNPVLNARNAALPFLLAGFVFVPVGVAVFLTTSRLQEYQFDYTECRQVNTNKTCASVIAKEPSKSCVCYEIITLPEDFQQSVNVYYGLTSYYQNFRFYVQSRDDKQLLGHPLSARYACKPYDVDAKGYAVFPCGAIANSLFNDTFKLRHKVGTNYRDVELSTENITWPLDHERKFRNPIICLLSAEGDLRLDSPPDHVLQHREPDLSKVLSGICRNDEDGTIGVRLDRNAEWEGKNLSGTVKPHNWPLPVDQIPGGLQNEAFIVWMRTAALPSLRKLYGRIVSTGDFARVVPRGEYYLEVHYRYPVTGFGGTKRLILSNASWMGSRNPFIAIAYVCVGCLCVALGLAFLYIHLRAPWSFRGSLNIFSARMGMMEISDFEKHRHVWRARKPSLMPLPQPRSASKAGRPPSKSSLR
ncbi:cell cycle control protein 50B-like [Rhipicephalus microplus]|uniref:cell cycle control protein 50B-like n=1 Tax=Rhipicephalus microplus TaxID=6941 RepID=UPI003F6AE5AD